MVATTTIVLSGLITSALAVAEPAVTAAAELQPRQYAVNPVLVGYISASDGYDNPRSCDYPQTLSTSGSFAQCCPESGSCPFYTACSSNTLLAAGSASAVPCDVDPGLTCNTAVLATTAGASGGASYLACWQKSLGEGAFTFVQDIGSAVAATAASSTEYNSSSRSSMTAASETASSTALTQTASRSSSVSGSSTSGTKSSASTAATSASTAESSSSSSSSAASSGSGAGPTVQSHGFEGLMAGAVALLVRFLL